MTPDGKVSLNGESGRRPATYGLASASPTVGRHPPRQEFVPGRDVLIYVGATGTKLTKDPNHRSRSRQDRAYHHDGRSCASQILFDNPVNDHAGTGLLRRDPPSLEVRRYSSVDGRSL